MRGQVVRRATTAVDTQLHAPGLQQRCQRGGDAAPAYQANALALQHARDDGMRPRPAETHVFTRAIQVVGQVQQQQHRGFGHAARVLGSGRVSQESLENQCQLTAQRMSLLYELNSPEFFDKALFKNFIDLLRARNVIGVNAEGRLTYTEMLLAVSADAQLVLHEQILNSILQVTHL